MNGKGKTVAVMLAEKLFECGEVEHDDGAKLTGRGT